MGTVTIKGAAEIIRNQLRARQAAGRLPTCLRFQVRATRGGKINIAVDDYRDLIGDVTDDQRAAGWFKGEGKRLLDAVDEVRGCFAPPPPGKTEFDVLVISTRVTEVTRIEL